MYLNIYFEEFIEVKIIFIFVREIFIVSSLKPLGNLLKHLWFPIHDALVFASRQVSSIGHIKISARDSVETDFKLPVYATL